MAFQGHDARDEVNPYSFHIALGSHSMSTAAEDVESLSTVAITGAHARERAFERALLNALSPMPFQLTSPADSMPGNACVAAADCTGGGHGELPPSNLGLARGGSTRDAAPTDGWSTLTPRGCSKATPLARHLAARALRRQGESGTLDSLPNSPLAHAVHMPYKDEYSRTNSSPMMEPIPGLDSPRASEASALPAAEHQQPADALPSFASEPAPNAGVEQAAAAPLAVPHRPVPPARSRVRMPAASSGNLVLGLQAARLLELQMHRERERQQLQLRERQWQQAAERMATPAGAPSGAVVPEQGPSVRNQATLAEGPQEQHSGAAVGPDMRARTAEPVVASSSSPTILRTSPPPASFPSGPFSTAAATAAAVTDPPHPISPAKLVPAPFPAAPALVPSPSPSPSPAPRPATAIPAISTNRSSASSISYLPGGVTPTASSVATLAAAVASGPWAPSSSSTSRASFSSATSSLAGPHPAFTPRAQPPDGLIFVSPACPPDMRRRTWSVADYRITRQLYSGYASSVAKATCLPSGQDVVLKSYSLSSLSEFLRHQVLRELDIHARLQHPHVVQLIATFREGDALVLVLEYVRGGSLDRARRKLGGRMTEAQALDLVLLPLLRVLAYLHAQAIVHRDIKPENLLFTPDWHLKVCDFGVSTCLAEERAVTRTGSREYMAPEVHACPLKRTPQENKDNEELSYTPAVDVYSMGVMAYELLVGFAPLSAGPASAPRKLAFPSSVSEPARAWVQACLQRAPEERPTVQQLLQHPWVTKSKEVLQRQF